MRESLDRCVASSHRREKIEVECATASAQLDGTIASRVTAISFCVRTVSDALRNPSHTW